MVESHPRGDKDGQEPQQPEFTQELAIDSQLSQISLSLLTSVL